MLVEDRAGARRLFIQAWDKHRKGRPLEPLEAIVVQVVGAHPEYHGLLEQGEAVLERDFPPEAGAANPFLHMGLHVAIHEQLQADRPAGIRALYRSLAARFDSPMDLEHRMMDCLVEALWQAQRSGRPPDEAAYLECLRRIR